jgi:hypothetical protein
MLWVVFVQLRTLLPCIYFVQLIKGSLVVLRLEYYRELCVGGCNVFSSPLTYGSEDSHLLLVLGESVLFIFVFCTYWP